MKRRNFIKSSSLLSSAFILPGYTLKTKKNIYNDKIKLSLVGCGGRGTGAVINALYADDNIELISMCDVFEDRIERSLNNLKDEFKRTSKIQVKNENCFTGFDGYKKTIDNADVVILATPPGFRPQHFEYAVNSSKHVFVEKPVATDISGIKRFIESAKIVKKKKLNVVVGLQRRYQPSYINTFKQVKRGMVGKITSGIVKWNSRGVWVKEREKNQSELEYQMRNWYYFNWLCGDHIVEQHIHNIDVANWFIGDYPISAQGMGGREIRKDKKYGHIFDHHYVEFKYQNGATIHSQCRHQPGTFYEVNEELIGTKGIVNLDDSGIVSITDHKGNIIYEYDPIDDKSPYQIEHDLLFKSIRQGDQIDNSDYAVRSNLASIMGRMATYTGKVIKLNDVLKMNDNLVPNNLTWNSEPPIKPDIYGNYKIPRPGE
jgi:predicted dehydrogenase